MGSLSFSPVISFDDITKKFPIRKGFKVQYVHAVRNVSLDIYQGEIISIVGESGCGKTTLLRLLARIYLEDNGGNSV